jgi:hypothetical protein
MVWAAMDVRAVADAVEKFHDPVGNKIPVFYSAYFIE